MTAAIDDLNTLPPPSSVEAAVAKAEASASAAADAAHHHDGHHRSVRKSVSVPVLRHAFQPPPTITGAVNHRAPDPEDAETKLAELRAMLTREEDPLVPLKLSEADRADALKYCDDACLRRHLRARGWDVEKTAPKLKEAVEWRYDYRPHDSDPAELKIDSATGNAYVNGFDKLNRPIIYVRKRGEKAEDPWRALKVLFLNLEIAIRLMPPGVETVTLVMDMAQYSRANSTPLAVTRYAMNALSTYYPERLGIAYIVNAPWIFNTLWHIVSPFLDPVTRAKIRFVSGITETSRDPAKNPILEGIDPAMLEKGYGGDLEFVYDDDEYWAAAHMSAPKKVEG
ncbi:hypothetical protein HDU96_001479 [Phlyctochytrium bullatum]|nr:hypothetical protein HDU96_001479 [Phlyctochytrium bullatum]